MMGKWKTYLFWTSMSLLMAVLFTLDMLTGAAGISPGDVWKALFNGEIPETTRTIVIEIRLMKTMTAVLAGVAVSVSGLLMQTLFRNPLAGPYVLGISSGASLGAAVYVLGASSAMAGGVVMESFGLAGAAWAGAAATLALVTLASRRIKDIMVVLITGMMLGSGIDATVQILQYLSDETSLKSYIVWTMGSLGSVNGSQMIMLSAATAAGLLISVCSIKPLNLLLLGENYAVTMGLDVRRSRNLIFSATILLAGTVTAFCGPLGFLGLAVPHLTRFLTGNADHRVLLPGTALCGAVLMLTCDLVSKTCALPINAMTSLLGIPVVLYVVMKNKNLL